MSPCYYIFWFPNLRAKPQIQLTAYLYPIAPISLCLSVILRIFTDCTKIVLFGGNLFTFQQHWQLRN
ncbi:MAG: hypothetical protein SAJ37_07275 [Oscillatoria sp. PMC 1068.18]|nr:hypothetical protein [Oscillatoria sp. PMC 1076.18]MEC4988534.1 hypothetical protein [Oscillatoria sp. PMC 1068.18]